MANFQLWQGLFKKINKVDYLIWVEEKEEWKTGDTKYRQLFAIKQSRMITAGAMNNQMTVIKLHFDFV